MDYSIVFIMVLQECWFNCWTDSVNSDNTSLVCCIVVNYGIRQCCGKTSNEPDMRYDPVFGMKNMQFL